jgi:predicted 3-demethylubiquinone-9 3-methyltransferase (glyoxalase superfamily)
VSWQVVPTVLHELLGDPEMTRTKRVMRAFLRMKKFDIDTLKRAYAGNAT